MDLALLRKVSLGVFGFVAMVYLGICLYIYLRQTRLIFLPSPSLQSTPEAFELRYQNVWLPVPHEGQEVRLHGWWIPAQGREQGVVLYLHGNSTNISVNIAQANRFHTLGLSVLLIDYRGYGWSTGGFPSEAKVYQDAEIAWNYLVEQRAIAPAQILLYGHSLGGAIAINLAIHHPDAAGLIVQSSFTSMRDMTYRTTPYGFLPIDWLLTQRFDSIAKVPTLKMPVLFIHGTADVDVPSDMSETLYQAAPQPKTLWLVSGAAHGNVADTAGAAYLQVVQAFVRQSYMRSTATKPTFQEAQWAAERCIEPL